MAASAEVLTQQIVELHEIVNSIQSRLNLTEALLAAKTKESNEKDKDYRDDDLVDRKFFVARPFAKGDIFREWSDDFLDFVDSRKPIWGDLLRQARDQAAPIYSKGDTPDVVGAGQKIYRVLKQIILHPEARPLIIHVADKNVWEGFRQLHARFDPRNDQAADNVAQRIMSVAAWKCKTVQDIPINLARWEGLQREHHTRTGEEVLTIASKRQILLGMIPPAMKEHIRVQTLLMKREDLTFEKIRMFVLAYTQEAAPDVAMPMDMASFEDGISRQKEFREREQYLNDQWLQFQRDRPEPPPEEPTGEPLDSFGREPKGGGRIGKGGDGKANAADTAAKLGKDNCAICKRKGHWARECWFKEEIDPATGKKKGERQSKGGRAKGKGGKNTKGSDPAWTETRQCYNCGEYGHIDQSGGKWMFACLCQGNRGRLCGVKQAILHERWSFFYHLIACRQSPRTTKSDGGVSKTRGKLVKREELCAI